MHGILTQISLCVRLSLEYLLVFAVVDINRKGLKLACSMGIQIFDSKILIHQSILIINQ